MIDYKNLPNEPGVYIFKDKNGNVIYIGKASSIRNRVKQYFFEQDKRIQVPFIIQETEKVEYLLTGDQKNALFLEFKLISRFKPKYNVKLKDSNSYPYIKISKEKYPTLSLSYKVDEGTFFGPFSKVSYVKNVIETLNKIFSLKRCNLKNPKKLCIEYQMGNCGGVCQIEDEKRVYEEKIKKVSEILNGGTKRLVDFLKGYMDELAEKEDFENAAFVRDSIDFIKREIKKGKKLTFRYQNRDIVSFSFDKKSGSFSVLKIRDNYISDIITKRFVFNEKMPKYEVCKEIVLDYYTLTSDFNFSTLVLDFDFLDETFLEFFKDKNIKVVNIEKSVIDKEPYRIAKDNSDNQLYKDIKKEYVPSTVIDLKKSLNLKNIPKNIIGVDISHLSGGWNSGAVVFFEYGKPKKSFYRYYNLDEIGNDDYLSIREIFKRYLEKYDVDLAIIDGGLGQIGIAKDVLDELNKNIELISVAKKTDTIFFPNGKRVQLDVRSPSFFLIKKIIGEAHRFANKLRKIKMKKVGVKKDGKRNNS